MDVARDRVDVASADGDADVQASEDAFTGDDALGGSDADVGHVPEVHLTAGGRVDQQVADAVQALSELRHAPDDHVEDLLILEQAADQDARQERCGSAPDVPRLDAVLLGLGKVHLDVERRLLDLSFEAGVGDAADAGNRLLDGFRGASQHVQVLAVDTDDQVGVCAGRNLADPLGGIGQDRPTKSRIAVHDALDRGQCPVVVGGWIEAEPELARIGADDLVGKDGPADMTADVPNARDRPQLRSGKSHDPGHLAIRRAGCPVPMDEEVWFPERRQRRPGDLRCHGHAEQQDRPDRGNPDGRHGDSRPAHDPLEDGRVAPTWT